MLVRLMDSLKTNQVNALFLSLTHQNTSEFNDATVDAVSSLADTWINLRNEDRHQHHTRVRSLTVVKARGMGHYNDQQEFIIGDKGVQFIKEKKE